MQFSSSHKLVSFNVTSLFTNVPLNETVRLIAGTIYSKENPSVLPCDRDTLANILRMGTTGMFLYKDNFSNRLIV